MTLGLKLRDALRRYLRQEQFAEYGGEVAQLEGVDLQRRCRPLRVQSDPFLRGLTEENRLDSPGKPILSSQP